MENYRKSRTEERACACPFPDLPPDTPQVTVKDGSKIRNLMRFALARVEPPPPGTDPGGTDPGTAGTDAGVDATATHEAPRRAQRPLSRQILFTASGKGVSKAITCVEILKRRVRGLHQHTRLAFSAALEVWEPREPGAGLDDLAVRRNVPALWILLSRDPLDVGLPGYQAPGSFDALWARSGGQETEAPGGLRHAAKRRRGAGGGGGGGAGGGRGGGGGARGGGGRGRGRGGGGRGRGGGGGGGGGRGGYGQQTGRARE